jgi:hypothetical protein
MFKTFLAGKSRRLYKRLICCVSLILRCRGVHQQYVSLLRISGVLHLSLFESGSERIMSKHLPWGSEIEALLRSAPILKEKALFLIRSPSLAVEFSGASSRESPNRVDISDLLPYSSFAAPDDPAPEVNRA